MAKAQKEFPKMSFRELKALVEKTLRALQDSGHWQIAIRKREERVESARWIVEVPSELLIFWDPIAGWHYKFLILEVRGNRIFAECKEEMGGWLVIDWQREKQRIINEFFLHMESMERSGGLYRGKGALHRRGILGRFLIPVTPIPTVLIIAVLVLTAVIMYAILHFKIGFQ